MIVCEQCGKEHDGNYGSGRFCSRSCSNKWVALNQSPEAKARKIEKGKKNLNRKGWKLTPEQQLYASKKGGEVTASIHRENRKKWLEEVISGRYKGDDVYRGSYTKLKEALIEFEYKERKCESCGLSEWLGDSIPLELHHIDAYGGHVLSNLLILCPNCHAMTDNHGWKCYNKYRSKES